MNWTLLPSKIPSLSPPSAPDSFLLQLPWARPTTSLSSFLTLASLWAHGPLVLIPFPTVPIAGQVIEMVSPFGLFEFSLPTVLSYFQVPGLKSYLFLVLASH